MKAARVDIVSALAELGPRMQGCEDQLQRGFFVFRVKVHGNAPTIVYYGNRFPILMKGHGDGVGVTV